MAAESILSKTFYADPLIEYQSFEIPNLVLANELPRKIAVLGGWEPLAQNWPISMPHRGERSGAYRRVRLAVSRALRSPLTRYTYFDE